MRAWPPLLLLGLILLGGGAAAATGVCVFGPGGPAPAMHAAAAAFAELHPGVTVQVTAGPTPQWLHAARARSWHSGGAQGRAIFRRWGWQTVSRS